MPNSDAHPTGLGAPPVAPDDLLTLLAVARLGKYTAAAHSLGINHTCLLYTSPSPRDRG